jgi:hypothetical protein
VWLDGEDAHNKALMCVEWRPERRGSFAWARHRSDGPRDEDCLHGRAIFQTRRRKLFDGARSSRPGGAKCCMGAPSFGPGGAKCCMGAPSFGPDRTRRGYEKNSAPAQGQLTRPNFCARSLYYFFFDLWPHTRPPAQFVHRGTSPSPPQPPSFPALPSPSPKKKAGRAQLRREPRTQSRALAR